MLPLAIGRIPSIVLYCTVNRGDISLSEGRTYMAKGGGAIGKNIFLPTFDNHY